MFEKARIITFDLEGWPIEKKTLREILTNIGFKDNPETGKLEIDSSMEILDCFPTTVEDDGMGYGTNMHYITDSYTHSGGKEMSMFIDKELDGIEAFVEDEVPAFVTFQYKSMDIYLVAFDSKKQVYVAKQLGTKGIQPLITIPREEIRELFKIKI